MATSPTEIPALAWKDIFLRVWRGVERNHIALTAAGVAFYGLLALFPAIAAVAGMAGLVLSAQDITNQIDNVTRVVPADAASIILDQAKAIAASGNTGLGIATLLGLTISIYSASKGVQSLMEGINIAYDESETRGFLRLSLTRFALTAFLVTGMVAGLGTTMVIPSLLAIVDLGPAMEALVTLIRWLVLFVMTIVGLMVLFRFGPDRRPARWRWLLPGSTLACVTWLAASVGFSAYVSQFASYNETFGALAGVIILLIWLWISSYVILLGAGVNAEAEAQLRTDTTTGPAMPLGSRGAVKADELA